MKDKKKEDERLDRKRFEEELRDLEKVEDLEEEKDKEPDFLSVDERLEKEKEEEERDDDERLEKHFEEIEVKDFGLHPQDLNDEIHAREIKPDPRTKDCMYQTRNLSDPLPKTEDKKEK